MAPSRRAAPATKVAPPAAPKTTVKPTAKSASKASAPKKAAAPSKTTASKRAPPAAPPADKSESDASEVEEEEEDDEEQEEAPAPTKAKRVAAPKKAPVAKKAAKATPATNGTKKTSSAKPKAAAKPAAKTNGIKRKVEESEEEESNEEEPQVEERPKKKVRQEPAPKKVKAEAVPKEVISRPKRNAILNHAPTAKLDVFVFGEGSSGELGLGSKKHEGKKPIDVKRPRINHNLDAAKVGVVQLACGGMHAVALTHDNRVLTWGQNDDHALGRDTHWEGGTRDIDDDESDDDDDDSGMNPHESTPGEVDMSILHPDAKITAVAACDSASFVLTDDGYVYAWGTFRGTDGIIGFTDNIRVQPTPALIPELRNITRLATGSNHVLAMDKDGKVFTWGAGGQFQLGRRTIARRGHHAEAGLKPEPCGKFTKKHFAVDVSAGSYHSFYIDNNGQVWGWGLNNFSQTGLGDRAGSSDAMIEHPTLVRSLEDKNVKQLSAGVHHSIACTKDGNVLTWGRVDGHQTGHKKEVFTEDNAIFDDNDPSNGKPRILTQPTALPDLEATFVAAGTDNNFAIDDAGTVYSWGFSTNYQTGQGTLDDVEEPTPIDNTALRGRTVTWAGAGGQYSVVVAPHDDKVVNGN